MTFQNILEGKVGVEGLTVVSLIFSPLVIWFSYFFKNVSCSAWPGVGYPFHLNTQINKYISFVSISTLLWACLGRCTKSTWLWEQVKKQTNNQRNRKWHWDLVAVQTLLTTLIQKPFFLGQNQHLENKETQSWRKMVNLILKWAQEKWMRAWLKESGT